MKTIYIYLITTFVLFTSCKQQLESRLATDLIDKGFTKKYNVHKLVYFEVFDDITNAIVREKQIKGWTRKKKILLIESSNSNWDDIHRSIV